MTNVTSLCTSGLAGEGGGRANKGHVFSQKKGPHHRGLFGSERRRKMEADLQRRLDGDEQQGHLWHVRLPCRQALQQQALQVRLCEYI